MKEYTYRKVFCILSILLIIIIFNIFLHNSKNENEEYANSQKTTTDKNEEYVDNEKTIIYEAGVYNKKITLGNSIINLQVVLDEYQVKSVEITNLDDTISALYPLMESSVKSISNQLAAGVLLDEVVLSDEGQYTEKIILNEVDNVLYEHKIDKQ